MLSRRHLFSAPAAIALAAMPVAAQASAPEPWDTFIAAMEVMHPRLGVAAREARARGFEISECYCIQNVEGCAPALLFRRLFNTEEQLTTFQNGGLN
ncbi:hypothetical protein [Brevundimonas sp.]|uniref:hypothetical protein n=1 Tax=Brevundimonas sp. TaxID=1871086 RepID=UPI00289C43F6|nr:hypothetical protein [Brevundimonas sp.]